MECSCYFECLYYYLIKLSKALFVLIASKNSSRFIAILVWYGMVWYGMVSYNLQKVLNIGSNLTLLFYRPSIMIKMEITGKGRACIPGGPYNGLKINLTK